VELENVFDPTKPDQKFEVWARIKFTGPRFPHARPGDRDAIYVERLVLVNTGPWDDSKTSFRKRVRYLGRHPTGVSEGQCMPRSDFEADEAASVMSPKNDSGSSLLDRMGSMTIDLDALLTPEQFAQWVGESELWVRRRLASLPGVIREGRKHVRIHPRTYLEKRLGIAGPRT
jgi:hypothetical protein